MGRGLDRPMKLGVVAAGNASWTWKNLAEGRERQLITTMDQKYIRAVLDESVRSRY